MVLATIFVAICLKSAGYKIKLWNFYFWPANKPI
jgi:hypothetical protein